MEKVAQNIGSGVLIGLAVLFSIWILGQIVAYLARKVFIQKARIPTEVEMTGTQWVVHVHPGMAAEDISIMLDQIEQAKKINKGFPPPPNATKSYRKGL